jgi:ATP-binding cassette, subfamily C (CFTR/MRP), member 1
LPQIIRQPLIFLPFVLGVIVDAVVALGRISKFLNAEELEDPYRVDYGSENAVEVDGYVHLRSTMKFDSYIHFGVKRFHLGNCR